MVSVAWSLLARVVCVCLHCLLRSCTTGTTATRTSGSARTKTMRKIRGGMILLLKGRSETKVSSDESGGPSTALRRVPAVLPPGAKDPRRRQVPRVARGRRLGLRPGGTKRAALGHRQCHLPGGNLPGGTRSTSTSTPSASRRRPSTCRSTLTLQAWHDLVVVSLAVLVFVRVCVFTCECLWNLPLARARHRGAGPGADGHRPHDARLAADPV